MRNIYIPSIDGKDILVDAAFGGDTLIRAGGGVWNLKKFINTLDYSLESIKLREVYAKKRARKNGEDKGFSFLSGNKEYSVEVVNITFKYSVKTFNRYPSGVYVKYGVNPHDIELEDCVCFSGGEVVAVKPDSDVIRPVTLPRGFTFDGKQYKAGRFETVYSAADIRRKLYRDGFTINGIHYQRYKRSAGSSRVGTCLFIDKSVYKPMMDWSKCGIEVKSGQPIDLAAFESYSSLTLSSIIDTLKISPENILVIDDYVSAFTDTVMATKFDGKKLRTNIEEAEIRNSIWDGQSLMDSSLFGKYSAFGMLLLRNRFFKSCCFNTNLQQWFSDNGITDVSQLKGKTRATSISQIKLITTPSSIKYLRFGTLDKWFDTLEPLFGIVKHEKPTFHFNGRMVQAHYQLLNTIQLSFEEVEEFLKPSIEYLRMIRKEPAVLRYAIRFSACDDEATPMESANDIVYNLLGMDDKFAETEVYYKFCRNLLKSMVRNMRKGHVLVRGNYSTLCGNPIEMLKAAIGVFNGQSEFEGNTLHSPFFEDGEDILGSRSPHVTIANTLIARNHLNPDITKYLNLTGEIVCVNSIRENLLERLSGSDFDSDTMLITNDRILIEGAKRTYESFKVPTKLVSAKSRERLYTPDDLADLDIRTSVNKIGEIINLSQELNSALWHRLNQGESLDSLMKLYADISQLDVMSNLEIDSAKRENPADNAKELKHIKRKYETRDENGLYIRPYFFGFIDRYKGYRDERKKSDDEIQDTKPYSKHKNSKKKVHSASKKSYSKMDTTMDYVQQSLNKFRQPRRIRTEFVKLSTLFEVDDDIIDYRKTKRIIDMVRDANSRMKAVWAGDIDYHARYLKSDSILADTLAEVDKIELNPKTLGYLIDAVNSDKCSDIAFLLFKTLFKLPHHSLARCIKQSSRPVDFLEESDKGDIELFGIRFDKISR